MWSPNSASRERLGVDVDVLARPRDLLDRRQVAPLGGERDRRCRGPSLAVGVAVVETTATVRSGSATSRFFGLAAPSTSKPSSRSAAPAEALLEPSIRSRAMRTSETTGPPFCARPVWSSPKRACRRAARPSAGSARRSRRRCRRCPGMRTRKSSRGTRSAGSGRSAGGAGNAASSAAFLAAGTISRNDGQSPFTQEKSWLHDGLVDLGLAAELGLDRQHAQAGALLAAVAAALADALVDVDALRRVGALAALAQPAALGGARLVVDQHRDALRPSRARPAPRRARSRCAHRGDRVQLDAAVARRVLGGDDDAA